MPNQGPLLEVPCNITNRRAHSRQKLRSVAYIDLGPDNGGLILNLSESGLAVSTAMKILAEELPRMAFKLPGLLDPIEAQARIVWMSDSKKEAGLRFEYLQEDDAQKITKWIATEQGLHAQLQELAASSSFVAAGSQIHSLEPRSRTEAGTVSNRAASSLSGQRSDSRLAPAQIPLITDWQAGVATAGESSRERHPAKRTPRMLTYAGMIAAIALLSFILGGTLDQRLRHTSTSGAKPTQSSAAAANKQVGSIAPAVPDRTEPPQTVAENGQSASVVANSGADTSQIEPAHADSPEGAARTVRNAGAANTDATERTPRTERHDAERLPKAVAPKAQISAGKQDRSDEVAVPSKAAGQQQKANSGELEAQSRETAPQTQAVNRTAQEEKSQATAADASGNIAAPAPARETKLHSGTVEVHAPPFPSMRIPAGLRSQASGAGQSLQMGRLISRSQPEYPEEALRERMEGTVKVHVSIGTDGGVQEVGASGPSVLVEAATAAVHQWRYTPTLINGTPVEADEDIVFVFRLTGPAQ